MFVLTAYQSHFYAWLPYVSLVKLSKLKFINARSTRRKSHPGCTHCTARRICSALCCIMERHPLYLGSPALSLHTLAEMKQRGVRHYSPPPALSTAPLKPPALIPIMRPRPAQCKLSTPYSIDDILSKSDAKSAPNSPSQSPVCRPSSPASPHHSLSTLRYDYTANAPYWWHGVVHSMWKDRISGNYSSILP